MSLSTAPRLLHSHVPRRVSARQLRALATAVPSTPTLCTSVILARSPLLTPLPTPFESAYYAYQSRIARALTTPFPTPFYFKKGALLERKFKAEERARELDAFGDAFTEGRSSDAAQESGGAADNPLDGAAEEDLSELMPRESEADRKGDVKSLDRKGDRNLYLVVKKAGEWRFPQAKVDTAEREPLHVTARNEFHNECGKDLDTWLVGRRPAGVLVDPSQSLKTFFFKAHVFAGQARVAPDTDFAWLTKEEIQSRVNEAYWTGVKDMLQDI
ncbi:hypothetical protein BOTBODRAFT_160783 [Botryobasidium botryosum FD-172 SS1]|uniref:Large ribosomal subunit protein mL46 n=1 Tax=Botryobasidium botryosum (strain FD-172 SS1) TaxID=930990 RepID=A0A067MNK7_BOTB1|nr:hypothetical protein BOTBODRAFT_160783 [Botryobasidium botryosum FD-172 SS1]